MLRGLPASGKTTFAKGMITKYPDKYKRVNKDDIRAMMDAGVWSKKNEEFVLRVRDTLVRMALVDGYSVLVDDTNLHPRHESRLWKLADEFNVHLEIKDFTKVEPITCIERDMERMNPVGEEVIWGMYDRFLRDNNEIH